MVLRSINGGSTSLFYAAINNAVTCSTPDLQRYCRGESGYCLLTAVGNHTECSGVVNSVVKYFRNDQIGCRIPYDQESKMTVRYFSGSSLAPRFFEEEENRSSLKFFCRTFPFQITEGEVLPKSLVFWGVRKLKFFQSTFWEPLCYL